MSKTQLEVDCTRRCKSRSHGQDLTSAITKRSVSDEALASFIKGTCANFAKAFDFEGRLALHMAASQSRARLMGWLARHSGDAFVNAKDRESGYTPLHRSVFYGQIHAAVALMKIGVNTDIVDKDDYRALEHATLDRHYMGALTDRPCDVYVWGSNSNYTLGGAQQQRKLPDLLNCFSRTNTSVEQVCLGEFHSVWVCAGADGPELYGCGQLGRAGAPAATSLRPVRLRPHDQHGPCRAAAITLDSTVLLTQTGAILQYSLSDTDAAVSQSNARAPAAIRLPSVRPLLRLRAPLGLLAARAHCVAWDARAAYTWGTNLGQLGHSQPTDKAVETPKRVAISINNKEEASLDLAGACDAGTVLTTSRGDVYLLHRHICKKIAVKQINLKQVCVDAKVTEHGVYSRVTVLLLNSVGQILIWQDTTNKLTRCVFGLNHPIMATHITLTHDAMYFTTRRGEAYAGAISRKPAVTSPPAKRDKDRDSGKSALVRFLEKDDCTAVRVVRVPNVHRAVAIAVDAKGLNFACLQTKPTCGLTSPPGLSPSSMTKHMATLMETGSDGDILHDVLFRVGTKLFPAHIYIVAAGSEHLYKLYQDKKLVTPEATPEIVLENVMPEVFDRILRFIYTGSCDVAELGPCGLKIRKDDLIKKGESEKENIDVEEEYIENPSEVSAFEVYSGQVDKGKRGRRRRSSETPPRAPAHPYCDPVKLVQACAKRLRVIELHKLLDKFYYRDGKIYLRENATMSKTSPIWDRSSRPELVDTNVRSKDGVLVPAHKCVLAARLEYFNGMFMHSWSESKLLSTVSLPINHGILQPVIDFLYTDDCPEVKTADNIDFICNLLVVADQLFILRLREMCEVALANMITLKNCSELCQFAHTYNAAQLKQCCMEFIALNLCCTLENRSLEALDDALLEDISKYYCKFNPIMASRVVTPFYNAPSDDVINDFAKMTPVDLEATDEDFKRDDSVEVTSKRKSNRPSKKIEYTENEKARMRYESVSSVTSLDLSTETSGDITLSLSRIPKESEKGARDKQEKWIEVPTAQQKQLKVVQARLKAITSAKDILNESPTDSFVTLTKNTSSTETASSAELPTSSRMPVSPKDTPLGDLARSPQGSFVISHVGPKLSQKQRKKLAMQGCETLGSPQSLNDFFSVKQSVGSPPMQPRNPWKIVEAPVAASSPRAKAVEFNQILADQRKQKDDSSRIMTKLLPLTQLEDKAIEELERFYNIHEADDELISVRRIELQVTSPQWPHTAPK